MAKDYILEASLKEMGYDLQNLTEQIQGQAKKSLQAISVQTHAMAVEMANDRLKSTREMYIKSLVLEGNEEYFVVGLKREAGWIEDGYAANTLKDRVLNNGKPAKTMKDGTKYKIIPFQHNKPASKSSRAEIQIANYAKQELKRLKLDKIVTGANGKPIIGKVATVNLTGGDAPQTKAGKPILAGLNLYQRAIKNKRGEITKVKREVMTFRVMSEKSEGWDNKAWSGAQIFRDLEHKVEYIWSKMVDDILFDL